MIDTIKLIVLLVSGLLFMSVAIWQLALPQNAEHRYSLHLPFGIRYEGPSHWVVVLLVGLVMVIVAVSVNKGGTDAPPAQSNTHSPADNGFWMRSAYAAENALSACIDETGWVYTGTGKYSERWWFQLTEGRFPETEGVVTEPLVLQAEDQRYLRTDHFDSFTGTFLGRLFGIEEPPALCILQPGQQVHVQEWLTVGRARVWVRGQVNRHP